MAFEKRVCVLKQLKMGFTADGGALSGAVYFERLGTELTVTPRLLGIAPLQEGRYVLAVRMEDKTFCLELRGAEALKISGAPSIREGVAVLLCYVRGDAEPIAFGACGAMSISHHELLRAVQQEGEGKSKKKIPNPLSPFESPAPVAPNAPIAPGVPVPNADPEEDARDAAPFREGAIGYNDEAIADGNYYAPCETHEDDGAQSGGQAQAVEVAGGEDPAKDETDTLLPRGDLTYYKEIRERLDGAFKKYPPDTRLKAVFPQSEWVKADDSLLGIVYHGGQPRYLCVAVEKRGDAPAEMGGKEVFVPTRNLDDNEGFYIVFQDADTGEVVTVYDA